MRDIIDAIVEDATTIDHYDNETLFAVLEAADDAYFNTGEPLMPDNVYDAIRIMVYRLDPTNKYFIGVGSDERGGKVKLPYEMGSLNQVEIGEIQQWVNKHALADETVVISDKMDGTSCMIVYGNDGKMQIAYSRGNGIEGADIFRHISKIKDIPSQISRPLVVRAEVELSETAFAYLQPRVLSRSGDQYRNARNMCAGLMNAKKNDPVVYEHLSVVAYEVVGSTDGKVDQLEMLRDEGFHVVDYTTAKGKYLTDDTLADYINDRRGELDYAIDGIVIEVNDASKRAEINPTRETLNPAYAIKYKVADASNLARTEVVDVEWAVSKHGYLKPTIVVKPVELVGVTVTRCTGFNAKFINDNGIGIGAVIEITRSGDVIPFCTNVVTQAKPLLPDVPCRWNSTNVDLVVEDINAHGDVKVARIVDFFAGIDAPMLGDGNVTKLISAGFDTVERIICATSSQLTAVLGSNGSKVYIGIQSKLKDIPVHKLMGAHSSQRGLGARKLKVLERAFGADRLLSGDFTLEDILAVDGFEATTAVKVFEAHIEFVPFLETIRDRVVLKQAPTNVDGPMVGHKVVFTGFRDKGLEAAIERAGGEVQSSYTKTTTIVVAKDPNGNSTKLDKARANGAQVIGIADITDMLGVGVAFVPGRQVKKPKSSAIVDKLVEF